MSMRETVSSIRAYFVLSALLSILSYLKGLATSQGAIVTTLLLAGLGLALAYLYLGLRLKTLIVDAPERILFVLKLGGSFWLMTLVLAIARGGIVGVATQATVALLVTSYLFVNVRRLLGELSIPKAEVAQASA
jgi:hypothetical protein